MKNILKDIDLKKILLGPKQLRWERRFRWLLKFKKLRPTYVQWICTYQCNFKCGHCGTGAGTPKPDELSTEEIKRAIDSLANLGCEVFSITGGEPLLRKDIFTVIGYAKKKGIKVGIVSNGFATADYYKDIKKAHLDSVLVSIDGYGENHEKIRGKKGSYQKCLESLRIYQELAVPVRGVSTVILDENVDDIPKIVEDVWKNGANRQRLQPLVPEGRGKEKSVSKETYKKAIRIIYETRKKGIPLEISEGCGHLGKLSRCLRDYDFFCGCGWNTFTIMHDGSIMGCPAIDYPALTEGSIRHTSLENIWLNKFDKFRKTLYKDLPPNCASCQYKYECRGGCWLFRANKANPCFLKEAQEVAKEVL